MKLTDFWDFLMEGGYDLIFNNEETGKKQFKERIGKNWERIGVRERIGVKELGSDLDYGIYLTRL